MMLFDKFGFDCSADCLVLVSVSVTWICALNQTVTNAACYDAIAATSIILHRQ